MRLKGIKVGFALTGSHCTLAEAMVEMKRVADEGAILYPIVSAAVDATDTRFGTAVGWKEQVAEISGSKKIINSIAAAEPIGPQQLLDVLVVVPCTGNTIAKLANAITDSAVLMAIKAHLRNQRPVVLAVSTNDGLSLNAKNIGLLLNAKNIYMVPFGQDSPTDKPSSLKAKMDKLVDTIEHALQKEQIQPILVACD